MFKESETIRHACDVVGDDAGRDLRLRSVALPIPDARQTLWLFHKQRKEFTHDPARLAGHAIDFVVPIHPLEQESFEVRIMGLHGLAK